MESVATFTHNDWRSEQQREHVCNVAMRYIQQGRPPALRPHFLDHIPSHMRPSFDEIRELASKARIFTTDTGVPLLARKPTNAPAANATRPSGRAARLLNDEPVRIYVPMRMRPWVMLQCHSNTLCHLGTAKTLRLLEQLYWWIGLSASTRFWTRSCHKCQARKTSRHTVRWPIISIPLPTGPGIAVSVDCFGPLSTTPRGNAYISLLTDRFSRRADMYAVTAANYTAEGTANVLVDRFIPLWGCPASLLSDNGPHFTSQPPSSLACECAKSPQTHITPTATAVSSVSTTQWHRCVNEHQDDWDLHLPRVEFVYNNAVSAATGLAPNQVHMNRLPRFPMTVFDNVYARGHQSLARDQLEYVNLAADRQQRSYALVREQHAINASKIAKSNSALLDALHQTPVYKKDAWVWIYNSASTIRQGASSGSATSANADSPSTGQIPSKSWRSARMTLPRMADL